MNNRPLKFRAWTGYLMEYKVMAGYLGAFYCDGMNQKDSACLSDANTIYHEITPIMQYTGLKDKNGKEIWEGDIVEYTENNGQIHILPIKWNNDQFSMISYLKDGTEMPIGSFCYRVRACKVIGNIYENPEFLTQVS